MSKEYKKKLKLLIHKLIMVPTHKPINKQDYLKMKKVFIYNEMKKYIRQHNAQTFF